jgi:hypothetical protein
MFHSLRASGSLASASGDSYIDVADRIEVDSLRRYPAPGHVIAKETVMSALRVVSLSILAATLAAAATIALAASDSDAVQRADVKAQVLQARARGELARPGEAMQSFPLGSTSGSTLSRQRVRDDTLVARALGQLVPAGQGGSAFVVPVGMPMARGDVRESVRQANLNGELARAGEAMGPIDHAARAHMSRAEIVAMRTRR